MPGERGPSKLEPPRAPTLVSPEVPAPPHSHTRHQNVVTDPPEITLYCVPLMSAPTRQAFPEALTHRNAADNLDDCVECRYIAVQHGTVVAACTAQSCLPSTAERT